MPKHILSERLAFAFLRHCPRSAGTQCLASRNPKDADLHADEVYRGIPLEFVCNRIRNRDCAAS